VILVGLFASASGHVASIDPSSASFKLLSSDGSQEIGKADFETSKTPGETVVRGRYIYTNGEYDVDEVWLVQRSRASLPALSKYRHSFFHADGSLDRVSEADLQSGQASCSVYINGKPQTNSAKLNFPQDTYAGPAVSLPIRDFLRGSKTSAAFHNFHCGPGPKVYAVKVSAQQLEHWKFYPGESLEVDVQPDFGRLNVLIAPFVPKVRLWFDPTRDFELVGAQTARYYKGLEFLMVPESPR
jgi:hypothetical protein